MRGLFILFMWLFSYVAFSQSIEMRGSIVFQPVTPYSAQVEKTGVTNSTAIGDDGELRVGIQWPNPRFSVQLNTNCVLDNLTGLMWARNAALFSFSDWYQALSNCNLLVYGGFSDWRLPNIKEFSSLICYAYYNRSICNTVGTGPWSQNNPFVSIYSTYYWTSTSYKNSSIWAWAFTMTHGGLSAENKTNSISAGYTWPVRGP